ncbi:autotransporter outer membrane beta-barrel domain-containing protein [Candidatus Sodalis endolongispinus]|uniref:autotransporter outer membrane beta-barrel domain-containing protein n=1 Tax=Candidatus Sodalis endolongispinus TaxID=2812662 RepID=UPI0035E4337C
MGLYAGWQQQPGLDGAYIDGQLSYSWFNNDVQHTNVPMEHYRSAGVSGTLESGYRLAARRWRGWKPG